MSSPMYVPSGGDVRVLRYQIPLRVGDTYSVEIPGSIVHVGFDPKGDLCAWAVAWSGMSAVRRDVLAIATGHPLPAGAWGYLDTIHDDQFVWHVFVGKASKTSITDKKDES